MIRYFSFETVAFELANEMNETEKGDEVIEITKYNAIASPVSLRYDKGVYTLTVLEREVLVYTDAIEMALETEVEIEFFDY